MQPRNGIGIAVILHAALILLAAAPVLLGIRPALHPIGEARFAVVDSSFCMPDSSLKDVSVKVVATFPGARASHILVVAAPRLLVCRPSEVPIGVAFIAVIVEVMLFMCIDVVVLVHDVWRGRHRHRYIMIVTTHRHRHMNDFIHDMRFLSAASTLQLTTFCLVMSGPKVLPVVVVSFAIHPLRLSTIPAWPQKPQKEA